MTDTKHTPGPWKIVPQSNGESLIAREFETGNQMRPKGLRIVGFVMQRGDSLRADEANANLVAAAPELLEACERALIPLTGGGEFFSADDAVQCINAALAKARGQP